MGSRPRRPTARGRRALNLSCSIRLPGRRRVRLGMTARSLARLMNMESSMDESAVATPRLLGFRSGKIGPLTDIGVRLNAGLTVIYGLNGSGKSSLLGALICGAAGRIDLGHARAEVGVTHLLLDVPAGSALFADILGARFKRMAPSAGLAALLNARWPELTDAEKLELCGQPMIALFPTGRGSKRWDAWLCVDPTRHPLAFQHRERLRNLWGERLGLIRAVETLSTSESESQEMLGGDPDGVLREILGAEVDRLTTPYLDAFWNPGHPPYSFAGYLWSTHDDVLPLPTVRLGIVDRLSVPFVDEQSLDPLVLTRQWSEGVAIATREYFGLGANYDEEEGGEVFFHEMHGVAPWVPGSAELEKEVAVVGERANEVYRELLLGAPELQLAVGHYVDWFGGNPCYWLDGDYRELETLSRAERRWAEIAITLSVGDAYPLLIIDEPEAALHRSAEEHMARGLAKLASDGHTIVVATHAPSLLDTGVATVLEIRRNSLGSVVHALDRSVRDNLEDLGLSPSDLLGGVRSFVLVEGLHDEWVISRAIGARIENAGGRIYPMGGSHQAAGALESRFLFEWTRAEIVLVLDRDSSVNVTDLIDRSYVKAAIDGVAAAKEWILQQLPLVADSPKNQYIREFISAALDHPSRRVRPYVMSKRDVLEYLDPLDLGVRGSDSWDEMRRIAGREGCRTEYKFKAWLKRRGATLDKATISAAANRVAECLPEDLENLAQLVEAIV